MVATRRGVRVSSPTKTAPDQSSDVPATSSRRTRSTVKQAESPTQHALVETSSQLEKSEGQLQVSPPTSLLKRCTRASRLHSPEQSCTPVGSVHEADQEDSCCSAVFDAELPVTRTRGSRTQNRIVLREDDEISEVDSCCSAELLMTKGSGRKHRIVLREDDEISEVDSCCSVELPMTKVSRRIRRIVLREDDETSEVESCCSAVSASKARQSGRRSTRRKTIPKSPEPAHVEVGDVKVDLVSKSQRVTRSQRKTAGPRSSAKKQTEDSELSDADSCVSSVSTTRRATRSRRQTGAIPIHLDETSEGSQSPAPRARMSRAAKGSAAAVVDVSEPQSCDSEGFESGPTYSMMTRRRGKTQSTCPKALDSDSELTDGHSQMGSPCTTRSKGTPCSSRTGSGSSSRSARAARTRRSIKDCSIVLEKTMEDTSINDSMLERTVILVDADCTLLEGDENQPLEEKEKDGVNSTDLTPNEADTMSVEKGVIVISEEDSPSGSLKISDSPACAEEAVTTPAVTDQQEEPRAENTDGDASEMMMQETIQPSEPLKPHQSATATSCESASEITEETEEKDDAMEVAHVDTHAPQGDEDAAVESGPTEEEKMEVGTLNIDAQQLVDSNEVQVESIQVTSSQQQSITVDSDPEQQPKDVIVQNTKIISLLESSEDEDEDAADEEREVSGEVEEEEEEEFPAEEKAGPSQKCEAAAPSVDGLFMIDTRPGQEADEQYYKERPTGEEEEEEEATTEDRVEQEEQDEEFVDEEGDDEDAEFLFSSRNPQLKEMSSRIDPGFRVKELGGLYIYFDGSKSKPVSTSLRKLKEKKIQDEVMKKSVMGPEFEKKEAVPSSESKRALKLKHRTERAKSTGDGWFNMKAPELTQELKGDLQVLKMRGSMDPKRFYKKNDRDGFPKYVQVGTVVDNPIDFYHSRLPKRARKRTMVEELLCDAEFRHNNKKKYQHIVTERAAQGAGKRNKKKSKFHKK